jgi:hypothetical protein
MALQDTGKTAARRPLHLLLFFLVTPVIVSFIETLLQLSMAIDGDLAVSFGFALLFTVPGHFFAWAMTSLIARFPPSERLPLPVLLLLGYALSILVFRPYNRFIYDLIPVAAPHMQTVTTSLAQDVARFLFVNVPGMVIWAGLNMLFIAGLGYPVYRKARVATATSSENPPPQFCSAAGLTARDDLWAISAEEHYLRLHSRFGTRMIRHSFGAALDQLPPGLGMRVHRSHWVAFGSGEVVEDGKGVRLADGTILPVSSSYRQAVLLAEAALRSGPSGEPLLVPERSA